ncbi:MAG: Adenylate cyclase 1 [Phycisphaerae bacterium]|nr:Adenylate cyclase 1 [Phycisphaerae bacterium]
MSDAILDPTIHREQTRNERVLACIRLLFIVGIVPDFFGRTLNRPPLGTDLCLLAYIVVLFVAAWPLAGRVWFKFAAISADAAAVLLLQFVPRGPQEAITGYAFLTLFCSGLVISAALRVSRRATAYAGWLGLGMLVGVFLIRRNLPLGNFIGILSIYVVVGGTGYYVARRMRAMVAAISRNARLARFMPPELVAEAARNPNLLRLGGRRQSVTILFADIRNFTPLAESRAPEDVIGLLNDYFRVATEAIFRYRGTLDKFMGDALMALFGAPLTNPDDADRAVSAAVQIMGQLADLNARLVGAGRPSLQIGIGINTATVIAGNVGTEQRMDYTVIGDGVNVAARLEKLTKQYDTKILISESTWQGLHDKRDAVCHGPLALPGRSGQVTVYGLPTAAAGRVQGP